MKKKRTQERPIGAAIGLSVAVAFGVGLLIGVAMLLKEYTHLRLLYDLISGNQSGEMVKSSLYKNLNYERAVDDVIVTAVACLAGGLAAGKLASATASIGKKIAAACASYLIYVGIFILGFQWGIKLYIQHGKLAPEQLNHNFLLYQGLCLAGWLLASIVGAVIGHVWQKRGQRKSAKTDPKVPVAA